MDEAHERLITIIKLIEQKYGVVKITPNLHLSLHLKECVCDYGPLYVFWCFSFERMNGILGKFLLNYIILLHSILMNFNIIGSLPNSHRKIEPELMRRLMNDLQIVNLMKNHSGKMGFEFLNNRSNIDSISELDQFSMDELY